jgi:hypothetical protein
MTYKVQINDEVRDATPDEAARIEQAQAEHEAQAQAAADKAAAAASGRAKLAALGLTDDEINSLLGA